MTEIMSNTYQVNFTFVLTVFAVKVDFRYKYDNFLGITNNK